MAMRAGRGCGGWLVVALWFAAVGARAQEPAAANGESVERTARLEAKPANQVAYKLGLALTYALPPMLVGIGAARDNIPAFSYAAIPVAVLGAPLYHLVWRRPGNAGRALAGITLSVLAVGAVGTLAGIAVGAATEANSSCEEGCYNWVLGMAFGSAAGVSAGFLGWAIYDVVTARYEPPPPVRPAARASITPTFAPLVGTREGETRFEGVVLGVSGRL
jgi:hypothetical protein